MGRIVYRGAYATFPMVGLTAGDLAYATDYLVLYEWSGAAWIAYSDYPDYQGEKSKLFTTADWAAVEATDQNFTAIGVNLGFAFGALVAYVVPAGRTLYITQVGFVSHATVAADGDNNQIAFASILDLTTGIPLFRQGGNGGGAVALNKPLVIPGGNTVNIYVTTYANHNVDIIVHAGGYLI